VAIAYVANRDRRYLGRKQLIQASAKGVSRAPLTGEDAGAACTDPDHALPQRGAALRKASNTTRPPMSRFATMLSSLRDQRDACR
jgi:hypothetical protein